MSHHSHHNNGSGKTGSGSSMNDIKIIALLMWNVITDNNNNKI